jgi:hypothetical protein
MKRFLKNTALFAFFIFSAITIFQFIISPRIKGKTIRRHDNLEQTANINADLVFLGSSRCWGHFDPRFFDTAFNLKSVNIAVDGHSEISTAIVRLKDYLARNKPPKFAIFNFDPGIHPGSETDNVNFTHKDDFARYAFLPNRKDALVVNYFKFNFAEKYIPLYVIFKYQLLSSCISLTHVGNYVKYGYERHNEQWDTITRPVNADKRKNYWKEEDKPGITKALRELKKLSTDNKITLICIQTPVYKILHDDVTFSWAGEICRSLDIAFIDANLPHIRDNINYFYNSNHLNLKGVNEMNRHFKNNVLLRNMLNPTKPALPRK